MTTATPTPAQQAGTILHGLLSELEGDAFQNLKDLTTAFGQSLVTTPTEANVVAQAMALALTAPLKLPGLESEAIGQFGAAVVQLSTLIPNPAASAPATPVPGAPVTVQPPA